MSVLSKDIKTVILDAGSTGEQYDEFFRANLTKSSKNSPILYRWRDELQKNKKERLF